MHAYSTRDMPVCRQIYSLFGDAEGPSPTQGTGCPAYGGLSVIRNLHALHTDSLLLVLCIVSLACNSHSLNAGRNVQLTTPVEPAAFALQLPASPIRQPTRLNQFRPTLPAQSQHLIWQAFSKAPDDNPIDQPKTTYDRQDVPATKPGMDAPESPDATNPEIDRSDYSAPGTNPDVDHNDPEDYKPKSDDVEDLKHRGRTGKSKLPGSKGQQAGAHNLFASQLGLSMSGLLHSTAAQPAAAIRRLHVFASSNDEVFASADGEENVGKDKSAGAVVCLQAFAQPMTCMHSASANVCTAHCMHARFPPHGSMYLLTLHDYTCCSYCVACSSANVVCLLLSSLYIDSCA